MDVGIAERQREIIRILSNKRLVSMQSLATTFGVTYITIKRDIIALTCDYPIETVPGRHGGVRTSEWYNSNMDMLSNEEREALKIAALTTDANTAELLHGILCKFKSQSLHAGCSYRVTKDENKHSG